MCGSTSQLLKSSCIFNTNKHIHGHPWQPTCAVAASCLLEDWMLIMKGWSVWYFIARHVILPRACVFRALAPPYGERARRVCNCLYLLSLSLSLSLSIYNIYIYIYIICYLYFLYMCIYREHTSIHSGELHCAGKCVQQVYLEQYASVFKAYRTI